VQEKLNNTPEGRRLRNELNQELGQLEGEQTSARESAEAAAQDPDVVEIAQDDVSRAQQKADALEQRIDEVDPPGETPAAEAAAAPVTPEDAAFGRDVGLNAENPAVPNRTMTCRDFIAQHRRGSVLGEFPGEYLDVTVEQALRDVASGTADSVVRKLLVDGRWRR
jgi:flagellar hook-basal body complex protein FliE